MVASANTVKLVLDVIQLSNDCSHPLSDVKQLNIEPAWSKTDERMVDETKLGKSTLVFTGRTAVSTYYKLTNCLFVTGADLQNRQFLHMELVNLLLILTKSYCRRLVVWECFELVSLPNKCLCFMSDINNKPTSWLRRCKIP